MEGGREGGKEGRKEDVLQSDGLWTGHLLRVEGP